MSNTNDFLSQLPPAAVETEKMLISAILKRPEVLSRLFRLVEPRDFYDEKTRAIFAAMSELLAASTPLDAATIAGALRRAGQLSIFGADRDVMLYLAQEAVLDGWPAAAEKYARTVHEIALIREAGQASYRIAMVSLEAGDAREFIADAQSALGRIAQRQVTDEPDLPAILDKVLEGSANRDRSYLPTGFRDFDELLDDGFRRGQLVVVAAQTSKGKSASL
jgi:replicative DNA helicase